ncbi:phosphoribosylanthranilate isomerase [Alienimonas californiensis]|uniref:N-(5'-phosphoribosyl)anthranilate isomerase n=1 Tax=Alienimonas californiensis TaxID=2527989 RepID=A0A517PCA6_9PLAN|nr:phosphoribosylanthranilate isomerase [Alienimonas californiensis]QDT16999.1 N-(5'-phosphoribosyl)anthranilate isomerase [Alienimonas californiensis]
MFVKICGFTDPANVAAVCGGDDPPDAIGLNFWDGSKRFVGRQDGALGTGPTMKAALPDGVSVWGVFVNMGVRWITDYLPGLDAVQFHGDESPHATANVRKYLRDGQAVRAWRVRGSLDPLVSHLEAAKQAGSTPDRILLDAAIPGAYGGTGAKLDWHALRGELDRVGDALPPVILAGGLTPENVAEAIRIVRPWGVDVAGGVESAPGIKDPAKVAAFCDAARGAL